MHRIDVERLEDFLLKYPSWYDYVENQRKNISTGGRDDVLAVAKKSGVSDRTGRTATKLAGISEQFSLLEVLGRWIEEEMPPMERPLLLDRWRGLGWGSLSRLHRQNSMIVMHRWRMMVASACQYAGHVYGVNGVVCVTPLPSMSRDGHARQISL